MTYNVYFKTFGGSFNVLNISDKTLGIIIDAYKNEKSEFTISGKTYWINDLFEFKIFEFNHPEKFDDFISLARKNNLFQPVYFGEPYLPPEVLKQAGKDVTDDFLSAVPEDSSKSSNLRTWHSIDIFISHSSADVEIAKAIIDLLIKAFKLPNNKIRCTSVPGYKLAAGANTEEELKKEIFSSRVFLALITTKSIHSTYVLFEIGARWGQDLPLFPLICDKSGTALLEGPIKNINALDCANVSDVHQLISDLSEVLGLTAEKPESYASHIQQISKLIVGNTNSETVQNTALSNEYDSAYDIIKMQSEIKWPDDHEMRLHYIKNQREAVDLLKQGKPEDFSEHEFLKIRELATKSWPLDFEMRLHVEQKQIESLRELKKM